MPVNCARVDEHLVLGVRDVRGALLDLAVGRRDDLARSAGSNFSREREVALVVRGHGHDRAGAVVHQHVVGDPDRDALVVHRVDGVEAGEDAGLLLAGGALLALRRRGVARVRRAARRRSGARSASRSTSGCSGASTKNVAPKSVSGPRREDRDVLVELLDPEQDLGALGAADPVALHRQHALGPDSSSAISSSSRSA